MCRTEQADDSSRSLLQEATSVPAILSTPFGATAPPSTNELPHAVCGFAGRFEEHFIEKIKGGLTEPAVALQDVPQAKENKLADECCL
jgi:hypothetical protein